MDSFLKPGLYGHDLNLAVQSTFDELGAGCYEASLDYNTASDGVRERGLIGEATQRRL